MNHTGKVKPCNFCDQEHFALIEVWVHGVLDSYREMREGPKGFIRPTDPQDLLNMAVCFLPKKDGSLSIRVHHVVNGEIQIGGWMELFDGKDYYGN